MQLQEKNMQIAIELPNDFMAMQSEQKVKQEMRLSYALRLYKTAQVTLSKAAELANMDIYEFMRFCKEEQIPVINVTKEELQEELESMAKQ
jgi:predicted HTH domain antitoxin